MAGAAAAEVELMAGEDERRARFLQLIEQYGPALRRLAGAYLERAADREDLFQEIAVALWQALPGYRGEASERTWLYRIAHNVAITSSTKVKRRSRREDDLPMDAPLRSGAPDAEQQILRQEKRSLLESAIRGLAIVDREIVLLHLEGLSYAEMEAVSGLTESALATRLSRIRSRLKDQIQGKEGRR